MITPFGRYRWCRLPFGLSVSSEIFQRRLTDALRDLKGVVCVADDITVVGRGDTKADCKKDHRENLSRLQERCNEKNIKLNEKKAVIEQSEVVFMGHRISAAGVKPDESKIAAILNMPPPTDVHGVRRLCGMIQYLAKFVPNLAHDLEPLRALTKKDASWNWSPECDVALRSVKQKITQAPVLAFFDPDEELVLQVDSSKDGLGAVIMQQGRPLEYASRALTPAERRWAQIEKETLSLVFGLERFDQYTFGRPVQVHNDHKPLATILKKPISQASRRIQALMMRLYRYDIKFQYKPGTQLFIADTLSRAFLPNPGDDMCVLTLSSLSDVPDKTKTEVQEATQKDTVLRALSSVISEGWPDRKNDLPECVRAYFDVRDTLSEQDGIILKGDRVVVPFALRASMKKKLHAAHLGYDSMLRRARDLLYWPGMTHDIKQVVDGCEACQHFKPQNQKETLKQHNEGQEPWQKIGVDLFEIQGRQYLITVDYLSTFIEVDFLRNTSATGVISKLQAHFARYGIPAEIVSDQGPQFTSTAFKQMSDEWGITHTMSSPHHHQSNGKAEAAVKTVKHLMYKCIENGDNQYAALLELRNTPRQDTGLSPTQMLFGRLTRSRLPAVTNKPTTQKRRAQAKRQRQNRRQSVKRSYDKGARDMAPINEGHPVFYKHLPGRPWKKGTVRSREGEREYTIEGDNGGVYRRNRQFLRPTSIQRQDPVTPYPEPNVQPMTQPATPVPYRSLKDTADETWLAPPPTETLANSNRSDSAPYLPHSSHAQPSPPPSPSSRPQRTRRRPVWMEDYSVNFR